MDKHLEFENYTYTLPPNRQLLAAKLMDRKWFKNTDNSLKKQILSLPDDHEGFVFDLSERPDTIGSLETVQLERYVEGDYLITPIFKVYSHTTKKSFTKEYVSWKMGRHPGLKGMMFVEIKGKIKHFITIEVDKFPFGGVTYDAIGGIYQYSKEKVVDLPTEITKTIKLKLGVNKLNIKRFIDLGRIQSDNGLTINTPSIFAAVIDGQDALNLTKIKKMTNNRETLEYNINIVPIEQLDMYISKIDDAFFLSIICRLLAKKVISL